MTLEKYNEGREHIEQRYEDKVLVDATDENGQAVRVIDERRRVLYTESQIDAQIVTSQAEVDRLQAIKDRIITLKAE